MLEDQALWQEAARLANADPEDHEDDEIIQPIYDKLKAASLAGKTQTDQPLEEIKTKLRTAMVELSTYFTDKPERGNQIPMPSDKIRRNLEDLTRDIELYANELKTQEIGLADTRLKDEFGEDWLTYRDTRLSELAIDKARISESVPVAAPQVS